MLSEEIKNYLNNIIKQEHIKKGALAIYGTGGISGELLSFLTDKGLNVGCFVDREKKPLHFSKEVYPIDGIPREIKNIIISSILYQDIIEVKLRERNFVGNIIKILPGKDWMDKWCSKGTADGKTKIVFVQEGLHIRLQKHALALKKTGRFYTMLATRFDVDFMKEAFDESYIYKSERGLIQILNKITPDACFTYDLPNTVPKHCIENLSCPVIYALHDDEPCGDWGLKSNGLRQAVKDDSCVRFVLKNADGIIYKGEELELYRQGFELSPKQLRFDCYVMQDFMFRPLPKLSEKDGQLHVVQGSGVFSMKKDKNLACYNQYLHIAPFFTERKIHYHLYPASLLAKSDYSEYYAYQKECPYFHLHDPLEYKEYTKEITQYDFAVPIQETRYRWEDPIWLNRIFPSKIFGFIEAGLPMVSNLNSIGRFIKENGIGWHVPLEDLRGIDGLLKKADRMMLSANIDKVRSAFSMENHIEKLIVFVESIIRDKSCAS